ncbi:MAG: hypothetical protein J7501_16085 [Bdellovibrio sp.]|nr:hypothetical protein [Bdellovibrio sp.]
MKLLILIMLISSTSHALIDGDKVGNGGGLWVCQDKNQKVLKASLVDLYEARHEFGLTLIKPSETDPRKIAEERRAFLIKNLPEYGTAWSPIMDATLAKIRYVDSLLETINDALYRIKPLPKDCAGKWKYEQFANFTNQSQVLIRQDFWTSSAIQPLDKAALLWHETIYKWHVIIMLIKTLCAHARSSA